MAELRQMREVAFAAEKLAAQFSLESLERAGKRGLGDIAALSRFGQIQRLADR